MGGVFQHTKLICTEKQLPKKYRDLVEQCAWESGHGGYSGTFAEKRDFRVLSPPDGKKYWNEEKACDHASEENDKWGPAYVYRLKAKEWFVAGVCSE